MKDLARAHAALDTIESTLKKYFGGSRNDAAVKTIRSAVMSFQMAHDTSGYIGEKLGAIVPTADILYSPRKHKGKPESYRIQLFGYLMNIRSSIDPISRQEDAEAKKGK